MLQYSSALAWQQSFFFSKRVAFSCNTMLQYSSALAGQQSFFFSKRVANNAGNITGNGRMTGVHLRFIEGSEFALRPQIQRSFSNSRGFSVSSSLISSSQIASTAFTWGTVAVLPFYTLMVFVPRAALTRRVMSSDIPYAALGLLYGFLLFLSWTPATLGVIFATKNLLPELGGMTKMFSNEMTMASAWIHLLAVDLYAARQVFDDGLKNKVETRHSVILCLLFCPIGILAHLITKVIMVKIANASHQ